MFYVIERESQLEKLGPFEDCFIDFIPQNNNFHPKLTSLSLIYIRPLNDHKGYILCLKHSESFSLDQQTVFDWINNNTQKLFVPQKKEAMYHFPYPNKLYDVNFLHEISEDKLSNNNCIKWYYQRYPSVSNLNALIPISKHYENEENLFDLVQSTINSYNASDSVYKFNNEQTTQVFWELEQNGIKLDKKHFIEFYSNTKYPEFNVFKGKIYTQYNLYTTTGRPSNKFNNTNFSALNKTNGERATFKPTNDLFIEFDFQGYHPRLISEKIGFTFPKDKNTYEYLSELLDVTVDEAKELTFKQLYGGVWKEYIDKPFFREVAMLTDELWDTYQYGGFVKTTNKIFRTEPTMTSSKLLSYIIQSRETSRNIELLAPVLEYLKDKKTKLVLYTYDAFLIDFAREDGKETLIKIQQLLQYPVNIKKGKNYHELEKI